MGTPFMPWQRMVADIAHELDPAQASAQFPLGLPAYSAIGITVPRQSGKTTFIVPTLAFRCSAWPLRPVPKKQIVRYAAQTRLDAMGKWEEHVEILEKSPFRSAFTVKRPGGREHMLWPATKSQWGVSGVGEKSGHGPTLDVGVIDEAWAHEDFRLVQAFRPSMLTIDDSQLYSLSTMGTAKSAYLNALIIDGRERVEAGLNTDIAYFEWSAEDDADPADPATWASCMPALGYTQTLRKVQAEYDALKATPGEFERAFLNRATVIGETIWPKLWWTECADPESEIVGPESIGIDISWSRESASISAAGMNAADRVHIETIESHPGVDWIMPALRRILATLPNATVTVDAYGPARSHLPALERMLEDEPDRLRKVGAGELVAACGQIFDHARNRTLAHLDQPELNAAFFGAAKRVVGDSWAIGRKSSAVDVSPLISGTLAAWSVQFGGNYGGAATG